jgi:hypothetical protein
VSGRDSDQVKRACSVTAAQVTDLRGSQPALRKARFSAPALGWRSELLPASSGQSDKVVPDRAEGLSVDVPLVVYGGPLGAVYGSRRQNRYVKTRWQS